MVHTGGDGRRLPHEGFEGLIAQLWSCGSSLAVIRHAAICLPVSIRSRSAFQTYGKSVSSRFAAARDDALAHIGKPDLRVNIIELCRVDERRKDREGLATAGTADEQREAAPVLKRVCQAPISKTPLRSVR